MFTNNQMIYFKEFHLYVDILYVLCKDPFFKEDSDKLKRTTIK